MVFEAAVDDIKKAEKKRRQAREEKQRELVAPVLSAHHPYTRPSSAFCLALHPPARLRRRHSASFCRRAKCRASVGSRS